MKTSPRRQCLEASNVSDDVRCAYVGRFCGHPRSVKRNGTMHRYCIYHRERANLNQRRVDARKRYLKNGVKTDTFADEVFDELRRQEEELERQFEHDMHWLSPEELVFLASVVFDVDSTGFEMDEISDANCEPCPINL